MDGRLTQAHLFPATAPFRLLPVLALLLFPPSAAAALLRGCSPGDTALVCRLQSVLNVLYVAAAILAVLFAAAVWAAIRAYRRRQGEDNNDTDSGTRSR